MSAQRAIFRQASAPHHGAMGLMIFPWESDFVQPRAAAPLLSEGEAFAQAHRYLEHTGHRLKIVMERGSCTLRLSSSRRIRR
jgi:hypothetical protein